MVQNNGHMAAEHAKRQIIKESKDQREHEKTKSCFILAACQTPHMARVSAADDVLIPNKMASDEFLLLYVHIGFYVTK